MKQDITKIQEIFYELRVGEVMTSSVVTVTPQTPLHQLEELLRVHRISGAPVIQDDVLVGIISIMDLIQALGAGQMDRTVGERMTSRVEVLYADERVISAIRKLETTGYGRFPVADRDTGKMVGILTQRDIIKGGLKQLDIDYRRREVSHYRSQHFFEDVVSEDTSIILRYTVKALDFTKGGQASSQFKKSLLCLGVHSPVLRRVAIAMYEAEMNLVLHATDGGQMQASVRPDRIVIDVFDQGPGIPDTELAMQPGYTTAPDWIREMGFGAGMGFVNIKNCADEVSLDSTVEKGTHLCMLFRLSEGQR